MPLGVEEGCPGRQDWEKLSAGQKAVNRSHEKIRAVGEQAMATLKSWRLLRHVRCSPRRRISRVITVLHTLLTCENSG